jgi:uncharacterized protein (TIGR03437 family)
MRSVLCRFAVIAPFCCLSGALLYAQQDRIAARIDNNQRVPLQGHVHPNARPQYDRGPVAPSFQMPAITMFLKPSATQQSALQQTLADQQNPASPNYHKWLTPEQYASSFGASQADTDKIVSWLESQGFRVADVARSRTWITFSGTAEQVRNALGTGIHRYDVNGTFHYANATDPSIPAALSNIVRGFRGLHDFRLKPRSIRRELNPDMTVGRNHQIAPDDLATIYDIAPLYVAGIDGTGQKIAVVGQTAINLSDLRAFRSKFNLPAADPQLILVPQHPNPGITPGDIDEADLDLEWSAAVARNATIIFVYSDDVVASAFYAVDRNVAPVISMSYGSCEQSDLVDLPTFQSMSQQANAEGITWLAAAGDSGAADCEDSGAAVAQDGLAVDAPGSVPEITSMGGTEFNELGGDYWSGTNTANDASALSYIPERAWNDTAIDGSLSSGGGGTSVFFPKPAWQTGPGVPNDSFRHVPDIALTASADHDGYVVYTGGSSAIYGGTSVAAPTMAGIVALLNQYLVSTKVQSQPGLGNINPTLYRLANVPGVFHDVTVGSNSVPCVSGSPGCNSGSYGYSAAVAYDQATGLGSPDASNLLHQWNNARARDTAVVVSFDRNPVFQTGSGWPFVITLTEEAGVGTTLTALSINGQKYDIASTFSATSLAANGTVSSRNLSLSGLSVPANVAFTFAGVDASGVPWSQQLSLPFVGPQTQLTVGGACSAASCQQTYAPGMLLSVYGTQLGNFPQLAATVPLPNYLAGFEASIKVNGSIVPAPLYYVSAGQVNLQIPYEAPSGQVTLTLGNPYQNVTYTLNIASAAPGIFLSNGFVSAPFSSASRGQPTTLFITGEGHVQPALPTGTSPASGTPLTRLPKPQLPVTVTVAGEQANMQFIGIPSGLVGVTQINYQVPADAPLGVQQVVVTVGGVSSPPAKLTVTQ